MLNERIMSLTQRREMQKEFLIIEVFSLSDIRFLKELNQTIHKVLIDVVRINEEWLYKPIPFIGLQREFFMLVVVKNNLKNALLLQGLVLVLLVLRFKCIDGTIKFLLCERLRIYSRSPENDIVSYLESLWDNFENLSLARADRTNNCHSLLSSHAFNDTKTVIKLSLTHLELHGVNHLVKSLLDMAHEILFIFLSFGRKVQFSCRRVCKSPFLTLFVWYRLPCTWPKRIRCFVLLLFSGHFVIFLLYFLSDQIVGIQNQPF
mgnify:FL=1